MCIHYSLIRRLARYKVCLHFIVLSVTVYTVGYLCSIHRDSIFVDFVCFLSMIIYEVLNAKQKQLEAVKKGAAK